MKPAGSGFSSQLLVPFAAGAAVLLASLLNFLAHNQYPLLRPETAIVGVGILAVCLLMAALYSLSGSLVRVGLEALLVYIALDLNFDGIWVPVSAVAITVLLNRFLMPVVGIVFGVVLAAKIFGLAAASQSLPAPPHAAAAPNIPGPAIVHLILDEHLGIEGFPSNIEGAEPVRQEIAKFYLDNGFRLFGGAFSEYTHTTNSIPQILNFGDQQPWHAEHADGGMSLERNAYFDRLQDMGYAVHVYESNYLDFCEHPSVRSCTKHQADGIGAVAEIPLPATAKAALIAYGLASLSEVAILGAFFYDQIVWKNQINLPLIALDATRRTSTLNALAAFDGLIEDLASAKPGEVYFAHLLAPHFPYITDRDCTVKRWDDWITHRSFPDTWAARHHGYFDQLICVTGKMEGVLEALRESPAGPDSIVIVHGDHGSRITREDPVAEEIGQQFDDGDLISSYSTLFAIRAAGSEPGYVQSRMPIAQLLAEAARAGFSAPHPDAAPPLAPSVMLEDSDWRPVRRHPLPEAWVRETDVQRPSS